MFDLRIRYFTHCASPLKRIVRPLLNPTRSVYLGLIGVFYQCLNGEGSICKGREPAPICSLVQCQHSKGLIDLYLIFEIILFGSSSSYAKYDSGIDVSNLLKWKVFISNTLRASRLNEIRKLIEKITKKLFLLLSCWVFQLLWLQFFIQSIIVTFV